MKYEMSCGACLLLLACGSTSASENTNGSTSTGGTSASTGGASASTGGASASTGGTSASTGGTMNGSGGTSTGGTSTGGASIGGANTGGASTGGTPTTVECPTSGRYLPLVQGATWTYQVTDATTFPPTIAQKSSTVGALEDVGGPKAGVMAFHVTTQKIGGSTDSWQEDTGTAIVRHKELDNSGTTFTLSYYDPYKLRVDESPEHTVVGATWPETVTETNTDQTTMLTTTVTKTEQWSVVAVDEQLTVPAGTFCTLHVQRTSSSSTGAATDKTYWFARGVGKVRETGGATEELVSYTIP